MGNHESKTTSRSIRERDAFFARLGRSATVANVQNTAEGSVVVASNFRLVRVMTAQGCDEIGFEVKCIGLGHPKLFEHQSYC
ncbi:hypothetical protein Pelo_19760 [Pelomyxa schiedti]|nr:hypothetical protein Pelo_19760 [Pelomyxa schiedti]